MSIHNKLIYNRTKVTRLFSNISKKCFYFEYIYTENMFDLKIKIKKTKLKTLINLVL